MTEREKALKYFAEHAPVRCDSRKHRTAVQKIKTARNPMSTAQDQRIALEREGTQKIPSDIWGACGADDPVLAVKELEAALRETLRGPIDPSHVTTLKELKAVAIGCLLTRGMFVKLGGELFRIAAFAPDKDGNFAWREPDIRGFRYHPSQPAGYRKKCVMK